MEIDVQHDLYSYSYVEEELSKNILEHNGIQFCGFPSSGKTRVVKRIIQQLGLNQQFVLINLSKYFLTEKIVFSTDLLIKDLNNYYSIGKRIFFFESIPIDYEFISDIFDIIEKFRRSCIDRISVIFSNSTPLSLYKDTLYNNIALSYILFYQKINTPEYNSFLIKQNSLRYSATLPLEKGVEMIDLTGGIPLLVKKYFEFYTTNNNYSNLLIYEDSIKLLLGDLPFRVLLLLKNYNTDEEKFLEKMGLTCNGKLSSKILNTFITNYSKFNKLESVNGILYFGTNQLNKYFTKKEAEFLSLLINMKSVSKEEVGNILTKYDSEHYSLFAIDKFISRLREKLLLFSINPELIKTEKSFGYYTN